MSKKKIVIISIAALILATGLTILVLWLVKGAGQQQPPEQTVAQPKPGDSVAVEKTPVYKSCDLLPQTLLTETFGDTAMNITTGERSGEVAANLEVADECTYKLNSASLTVQVYLYSASAKNSGGDQYDASWRNVNSYADESYTLNFPAYYKKTEANAKTTYTFNVIGAAKNYRFIIEKDTAATIFTDDTALASMISLANGADFSVADTSSEDIPPAPNV